MGIWESALEVLGMKVFVKLLNFGLVQLNNPFLKFSKFLVSFSYYSLISKCRCYKSIKVCKSLREPCV